jgi:hypothetical protein
MRLRRGRRGCGVRLFPFSCVLTGLPQYYDITYQQQCFQFGRRVGCSGQTINFETNYFVAPHDVLFFHVHKYRYLWVLHLTIVADDCTAI